MNFVPYLVDLVAIVVALGLYTLWIISLAVRGAQPWFAWLVFSGATALLVFGLFGIAGTKRIGRQMP